METETQEKKTNQEINEKQVTLKIDKYGPLERILNDPKSIWKVLRLVFFLSITLFGGIALILVSLKTMYPYNEITTNVMGATTIRNETKEISYWLFNTADLWADSGIKVKKGETITIRASGKKHTAIHHLVESAYRNEPKLKEPWVGSRGIDPKYSEKRRPQDTYRARYKIFADEPQDALLLQIAVPGHVDDRPIASTNQFVSIGEQATINVEQDGVLFFAVNDIVLDDTTIVSMLCDLVNGKHTPITDSLLKDARSFRDVHEGDFRKKSIYNCFMKKLGEDDPETIMRRWKDTTWNNSLHFGPYSRDTSIVELYGYFMEKSKTPWFDDNVGSFLIIVEKQK